MPRGRASGYDTQRDEILGRAADLFARQGYTATTMNQVALACGVSKPALYHYVRDKYQLLVEIADDHVGRLQRLVDEAAARPRDGLPAPLAAEARMRWMIARFLDAYAGAQSAHRVLTEDVRFLAPGDRERVLDVQRRVVAGFAGAIAEARPGRRADALEAPLAMLLFGMMNWLSTWLRPGGRLTHAELAPIVADLFFGGLGAVRPPLAPAPLPQIPAAAPVVAAAAAAAGPVPEPLVPPTPDPTETAR